MVAKSIVSCIAEDGPLPPSLTALVELDRPEDLSEFSVKSPKSTALPVDGMVT